MQCVVFSWWRKLKCLVLLLIVCILQLVCVYMLIVSMFMLLVVLVIVIGFSDGVWWLFCICSRFSVVVKLVVFRIMFLCKFKLVGRGMVQCVLRCMYLLQLLLCVFESFELVYSIVLFFLNVGLVDVIMWLVMLILLFSGNWCRILFLLVLVSVFLKFIEEYVVLISILLVERFWMFMVLMLL